MENLTFQFVPESFTQPKSQEYMYINKLSDCTEEEKGRENYPAHSSIGNSRK